MGVTVDAVTDHNDGGGDTTISTTHSGGSAPSLAVVFIGVHVHDLSGTPTYAGTSMTHLASADDGYREDIHCYYIINPTGGSQTVSASITSSTESSLWIITLDGSDTDDPFRDTQTSIAATQNPSLTVTTQDGDMAIDGVGRAIGLLSVGSGQTQIGSTHYWSGIPDARASASYEAATGSSVSMDWTGDGNNRSTGHVALSVKPAPALRSRLTKYITNSYDPLRRILDNQGRVVLPSQLEFDEFIRSEGPWFPSSFKGTSLLREKGIGYIEASRYAAMGDSLGIEVVTETILENMFRRLGGGF